MSAQIHPQELFLEPGQDRKQPLLSKHDINQLLTLIQNFQTKRTAT
ncbi:hypothetical protein sync_2033 [Synechococcus sp. CC9311]|nr:hypothetical protein sync_2033 [Synechococcus sp. CC9311]